MRFLERLERALERLVEGGAQPSVSGRVHPVEIGREVARRLRTERKLFDGRVCVPNIFEVRLQRHDLEALGPLAVQVEAEIARALQRVVEQREYALLGPVMVRLRGDDEKRGGGVAVSAGFERLPEGPASATEGVSSPDEAVRACLEGREGFSHGKRHVLTQDSIVVGRTPDCDVQVPDARVSKRHARLTWNGSTYCLTTIGRNGTRINSRDVSTTIALCHGDVIALGDSLLCYSLILDPRPARDG